MSPRQVLWSRRAQRDLRHLPPETRARISDALDRLAETGHGDVKKLQAAEPPVYRLRVGDWRILYALTEGSDILVLRVVHRSAAYR